MYRDWSISNNLLTRHTLPLGKTHTITMIGKEIHPRITTSQCIGIGAFRTTCLHETLYTCLVFRLPKGIERSKHSAICYHARSEREKHPGDRPEQAAKVVQQKTYHLAHRLPPSANRDDGDSTSTKIQYPRLLSSRSRSLSENDADDRIVLPPKYDIRESDSNVPDHCNPNYFLQLAFTPKAPNGATSVFIVVAPHRTVPWEFS